MTDIFQQLNAIQNQIATLTSENAQLQNKLAEAERQVAALKNKPAIPQALPVKSAAHLLKEIPDVSRVAQMGIMELTNIQSKLKSIHAQLDRLQMENEQARAHNRQVLDAIISALSLAGIAGGAGGEVYVKGNKGPGRWQTSTAVVDANIVAKLTESLVPDDDVVTVRGQVQMVELSLIGALKKSVAPRIAEDLVEVSKYAGVSSVSYSDNKSLAKAVAHQLSAGHPIHNLAVAMANYEKDKHNLLTRTVLIQAIDNYENWLVKQYGSINGSIRVRLYGSRSNASLGMSLRYPVEELFQGEFKAEHIKAINVLAKYL